MKIVKDKDVVATFYERMEAMPVVTAATVAATMAHTPLYACLPAYLKSDSSDRYDAYKIHITCVICVALWCCSIQK